MDAYHEKMREPSANCLFEDALCNSSLDQIQMHPPNKLEIACAAKRRIAAARPSLKAS